MFRCRRAGSCWQLFFFMIYKRRPADFKKSTPEVTALTPTAGTYACDRAPSACDPGVIKFGGRYYPRMGMKSFCA